MVRTPSPWQNQALKEDVDNSGAVDPLDVLVLINEINIGGSRPLTGTQSTPPFIDVDGDRTIGPLDVLMVINFINSHPSTGGTGTGGAGGEGERSAFERMPTLPSSVSFSSFVIDTRTERTTTRIVGGSNRVSRLGETGAEKCGCPACTSFGAAGESSPAVIDIATASKFGNNSATKSTEPSLPNGSGLVNLDELLKNWTM